MTFLSPFNVRSPVFLMELFQAGHEIKYFSLRRVATGVILLGRLDNDIDDVGETAAAAAAFFHGVVDLRRHDKLPTVFIEKVGDNLPDFLVGYIIAAADKHVFIPNMTLTIVFSAKEDGGCQEKIRAPDHRARCPDATPMHIVRDYPVVPG
ncbi:hypothetical protein GGE16_003700 [Rhizobium leguminosarum]|uniref:Uncharacterized protein n=1 Tax=Rhizobium leguminosarum TaxID=384 RepID=A0AAE2MM36_RHILE|nr:hypothetical protein [Rhizobium leguminosarum]MBB4433864.1 hypothetical protein [Rhizobium esperanzae]MBB4298230.1 hypothetical protein [Rhizobium leguminosarum]MBB4309368.1 hypothetical protein [Rhizobium leguminosarum]MBB4418805.1 hypothetical protein [Rhizobium leguminosarum]